MSSEAPKLTDGTATDGTSNLPANTGPRALVNSDGVIVPRGMVDIDREDLIIPRIAIGQSTSKRVQDGEFLAGSLYNTVTGETYVGADKKPYLEFIPIIITKSRRLWNKDKKEDTLCMSNDGRKSNKGDICATACPFHAYDFTDDENGERKAPRCTLYYNYLSWTAPYRSAFPLSISMGKTSAKTAKQFNSFIAMSGEDVWARIYAVTTELKENTKGRFHIFKLKALGPATDKQYRAAGNLFEQMSKTSYTIHDEEVERDTEEADRRSSGAEDRMPSDDDRIPF